MIFVSLAAIFEAKNIIIHNLAFIIYTNILMTYMYLDLIYT